MLHRPNNQYVNLGSLSQNLTQQKPPSLSLFRSFFLFVKELLYFEVCNNTMINESILNLKKFKYYREGKSPACPFSAQLQPPSYHCAFLLGDRLLLSFTQQVLFCVVDLGVFV